MTYKVRINKKAWNPVTKQVIPGRLWEVEQIASKDSGKCIWHCAEVTIRRNRADTRIQAEITKTFESNPALKAKGSEVELEFHGIAVRGMDDSIVIDVREGHDVA